MIDTYIDDTYEFKKLTNMINPKSTLIRHKLITHMKKSIANLTSNIKTFSRGIQDVLDNNLMIYQIM